MSTRVTDTVPFRGYWIACKKWKNEGALPDQIVIFSYEKIFFFWPTILTGLLLLPFYYAGVHPRTCGTIFGLSFFISAETVGIDIQRNIFWLVTAGVAIVGILFGAAYMLHVPVEWLQFTFSMSLTFALAFFALRFIGQWQKFRWRMIIFGVAFVMFLMSLQLLHYMSFDWLWKFYRFFLFPEFLPSQSINFVLFLIVLCCAAWVGSRIDGRWEINPNQIEHIKAGRSAGSYRVSEYNIFADYPDYVEELLLGSGDIVLMNPENNVVIARIENVIGLKMIWPVIDAYLKYVRTQQVPHPTHLADEQ